VRPKLDRPSPSVVVAIPTIKERGDAWKERALDFDRRTCQPVTVVPSWAPGGWAAGLNEVAEQFMENPPDVFCCGSDDMYPEDDNWLPPLLDALRAGAYPAPTVIDPRWTNYGGHNKPVADGTPSKMSTFPVLHGGWLDAVFPLPDALSYYADNLIAVKLRLAGIECVAVPSSKIRHLHLKVGRGFGEGSEQKAMMKHSRLYSEALEELGVNRKQLHTNLRGAYWREPGDARA
jgi:GT2 family glycosyltransferase